MMKSFKDGDKDLAVLINDIAILEEALKGFDRVLRSRQVRTSTLFLYCTLSTSAARLVERVADFIFQNKHNISKEIVENTLAESQQTIKDLETRLKDISKSNISTMRRMKMVQNKSSFQKIHERIKGHSSQLLSLVQIAHRFVPMVPISYLFGC